MTALIHFALAEYLRRTHAVPELIAAGLALALLQPPSSAEEVGSTLMMLALLLGVLVTLRLRSRWRGATRDLYVLALGRARFELSLLAAATLLTLSVTVALLGIVAQSGGLSLLTLLPGLLMQGAGACALTAACAPSPDPARRASPFLPLTLALLPLWLGTLPDPWHSLQSVWPTALGGDTAVLGGAALVGGPSGSAVALAPEAPGDFISPANCHHLALNLDIWCKLPQDNVTFKEVAHGG